MAAMRGRSGGRATLLLLLFAALAIVTLVRADEGPPPDSAPLLELTWSAPDECPDRAQVMAEVAEIVGRRRPGQHPLTATGRVARAGPSPRYTLELSIGDEPGGARTMAGTDCSRLAAAAALILALDIDPEALVREKETAPQVTPAETPEVPPEPPPPPPRRRKPLRASPRPRPVVPAVEATLGARMLIDAGSLPRETLGGGGVFSLARGPLALELHGMGYGRQFTVNGPRGGTGGAYVDSRDARAPRCGRKLVLGVEWRGCLGGELGRESTLGVSIAQPARSAALWGAFSAGVRARAWPQSRVSPTVGLAFGHPVSAARVSIDGFRTVFEPPKAFIRGFLGIEAAIFVKTS